MRRAAYILWPLWTLTAVLTFAHVLAGAGRAEGSQIRLVDATLMIASTAVLPFFAGLMYVRRCDATISGALLAGISIPIVDVVAVGAAYLVLQAGWLAFSGFLIATAMFSLVPSALFGVAGRWFGRRGVSGA